jgi:hypothetical protein
MRQMAVGVALNTADRSASPIRIGHTRAPPQPATTQIQAQAAPKPDDPKKEDPALAEFLQIYHLEPRQNLKLVPAPRPKGIDAYWKQAHPGFGNRPDQFSAMTFRWKDPDRLRSWSMTTAEGFRLRDLPRYLQMDIYPTHIEGDPELLEATIPGDWIYREGAPLDQMVKALEARLQRTLRMRVALQFREVERDVVVVGGTYRYSPVANRSNNEVEIYGKQIVANGGGAGGGGGTFAEFLQWVGEWIERPVISEVEAPPTQSISWYYNQRSPFTDQTRREDHDEALVIQHLQEQTGLSFTRERKHIRILFVERPK